MRAMYPKSPAKRRWGIRRANILPPRGVFAVRSPQIMHGAQVLPPSDGLGPCAGMPTPASRQYPPPANACHSLYPSQSETSRRRASAATIRRMAYSLAKPRGTADYVISTGRPTTECCAELGLDSRTVNKWVQNRRRRPQARPASALPKTPIERTSPSWRNYRSTPQTKPIGLQPQQGLSLLYDRIEQLTSMAQTID